MSKSGSDEQPARRHWAEAVARDAAAVGQAAFRRAGFNDPSLVLRWDAIAGPEVAQLARPLRLTEGPHGGVLTLLALPGAAVFLQHESRALCDRINTFLGRAAVARLRFVQGPLKPRPAPPRRRPVPGPVGSHDPAALYDGPESLRQAIQRLSRARRLNP